MGMKQLEAEQASPRRSKEKQQEMKKKNPKL